MSTPSTPNTHTPTPPHLIPHYLSNPLLPFLSEFRRADVYLAGIECPLRAPPGGKGEHGQGGCHKTKCPSLENGQPAGGERMQLPTRSFSIDLSLAPTGGLLIQVLAQLEATNDTCCFQNTGSSCQALTQSHELCQTLDK